MDKVHESSCSKCRILVSEPCKIKIDFHTAANFWLLVDVFHTCHLLLYGCIWKSEVEVYVLCAVCSVIARNLYPFNIFWSVEFICFTLDQRSTLSSCTCSSSDLLNNIPGIWQNSCFAFALAACAVFKQCHWDKLNVELRAKFRGHGLPTEFHENQSYTLKTVS
jgi:hypothetical protein